MNLNFTFVCSTGSSGYRFSSGSWTSVWWLTPHRDWSAPWCWKSCDCSTDEWRECHGALPVIWKAVTHVRGVH